MRELPKYIELLRIRGGGGWRMVCRACGLVIEDPGFWPVSESAHIHAAWHRAEEDPPVPSVPTQAPPAPHRE